MPHVDAQEFLRQNSESDLLRLTTAGSVDDGKSTLIGRLLSDSKCIYDDHLEAVGKASRNLNRDLDLALLTDGLRAEQEQGITIDVAYRYFSTPKRRFIIADTPGHEQYTRNMVTGASTANLAIVLVDARNGLLTQSKRHAFIASLLGIPHMVVAVNKMDLVGYSEQVFEDIKTSFDEFAAKLNIKDLTYIPISALHGDNVVDASAQMKWYKGRSILTHLETVFIGSDRNLIDLRFPIQYVNRPHSDFRGYSGQVVSGIMRPGDDVTVLPSGHTSSIREIVTYDGSLEYASPPLSVTVTLTDEIDISRGDMIVHQKNQPHLGRKIEAMLIWMNAKPFLPETNYLIKHTTSLIRGRFVKLHYRINPNELHREDAEELRLNEIGRVDLELLQTIPYDTYSRNRSAGSFIVIDPLTNDTVGAGIIIDRISRSQFRSTSSQSKPVSSNITRQDGTVEASDRASVLRQKPATIWLTGYSGSGKSTIAYALEKRLIEMGHACFVLDGDNVRHGLNRDLGFAPAERTENIRRIAEVSRLMNDAGLIVLTAFISPYRKDRDGAREIIGNERFLEALVDTPLSVCEERDPKGLYRKARAGEIPEFTGIDSPYEAPENPEITIETSETGVEQVVDQIIDILSDRGHLVPE